MIISEMDLRLALTLFVSIFVCGCAQTQPTVPAGIPVPTGWIVLAAETNNQMGFEGTRFYARFESPLAADKASVHYGNALLSGIGKGFSLEGPVKLSDDEMIHYKDHQNNFERKHTVERSNYASGWKVNLSDEPSYYAIYAYPRENGSVVELLSISAL